MLLLWSRHSVGWSWYNPCLDGSHSPWGGMAWQPSCLGLFIDREFDSALPTACFTQTKLPLLQTLEKENEVTLNVIKYESGKNFPPFRPTPLVPGLETSRPASSPRRPWLLADMVFWFLSRMYWFTGWAESQAHVQNEELCFPYLTTNDCFLWIWGSWKPQVVN